MVCGTCRTVFPAADQYDHFARFGIPRSSRIDPSDLERRYLVLSRGLHPDQFAGRAKEERELSERFFAHVNDAYNVLRNPSRRAEYLLELEGGPQRAQDKRTPQGFLAEMLELNERIEEAQLGELDAPRRAGLESLRAELFARRDAELAAVESALAELPPAADARRAPALSAVREKLNAVAYLDGLVVQLGEILLR